MADELIELARYPTSAEAAIVRGQLDAEGIRTELSGEAVAGWLWHLGSAVGGVRLLISAADADRAHEVLGEISALDENEYFGDVSARGSEEYDDEVPEDLIRAWRAALIGIFLLPPLLNLYSSWLLISNRFFVDRCRNWRVAAASIANLVVFGLVTWIVSLIVLQSREPAPLGAPTHVEKEITIPLVPY
jgi:hypothetical protein